jgi:hypothetical protein
MNKDMSDEVSKSFMEKIVKRDSEVIKKLEATHREPDEVYKILKERLEIYAEADKYPLTDMYKLFVSNTRNDIYLQAAIVAAKDDFAKQVSQIISRLDNIENEIRNIKDKLSIS